MLTWHIPLPPVQAILLQNIVLLFLIYRFQGRTPMRAAALLLVLSAFAAAAASGLINAAQITSLYNFNVVLSMASRIPQILQNLSAKSTGQLSVVTYGLQTAGTAARIFTSVQERAGAAMVRGFTLSECWGRVIVGGWLWVLQGGIYMQCMGCSMASHWCAAHIRGCSRRCLTWAPRWWPPHADCALNAIIFLQILVYQPAAAKAKSTKKD